MSRPDFVFPAPDAAPCVVLAAVARCVHDCALVVITGIEGRTSRAIGTMMAVAADGTVTGSISGGCFDGAVAGEALSVLAEGTPRQVRFGAGSPWIDIKLPCGGGLDILIIPRPDPAILDALAADIAARREAVVALDRAAGLVAADPAQEPGWRGDRFTLRVPPPLHLVAAGNGGEVVALAKLALAIGAAVTLLSPEDSALPCPDPAITHIPMKTARAVESLVLDRWTALAVLFHDHDWEPPLLARALLSDAFFVGAMGSRDTHLARLAALRHAGLPEDRLARLTSPIGLFGPARNPRALALSTLAQIQSLMPGSDA